MAAYFSKRVLWRRLLGLLLPLAALIGLVAENASAQQLPIGTVIGSMLDPVQFASQAGDPIPPKFDAGRSKWSLADGRDLKGSKYIQIVGPSIGTTTAPDMRGLFLRGKNAGRTDAEFNDPSGERLPGSSQADALQGHSHSFNLPLESALGWAWGYGGDGSHHPVGVYAAGGREAGVSLTGPIGARTDVETRPRNVVVYWYIRIN